MSKIYDALKRAEREREAVRATPPAGAAGYPGDLSPSDLFSTECRRLQAALMGNPALAGSRGVLLSSVRHGEGTTRIALGLAQALASEHRGRVLLVEANLRSPSLARSLALGDTPGLSDVLAKRATADALINRTAALNGHLAVVHAGSSMTVVDGEALAAVVLRLAGEFDFTVVDGPPASDYEDIYVLAPKMDGVILVVEADSTPIAEAESAKRDLDRTGARLIGVVLNRRHSYVPASVQALL